MNSAWLAALAAAAAMLGLSCSPKPPGAPPNTSSAMAAPAPPGSAPGDSGVYGFSGAKVADGNPQGVIGECIWIFDPADHVQVAKGDCVAGAPGAFRVKLKPGRYVIHGPGGNQPIEVKPGGWIRIVSLVALPMTP